MKRVSARSGMFSSISGSADSNAAACSFSAEFFAPKIGIVPLSGRAARDDNTIHRSLSPAPPGGRFMGCGGGVSKAAPMRPSMARR